MKITFVTNYLGMLSFHKILIPEITKYGDELVFVDYGSWAIRDSSGVIIRSYAKSLGSYILKIPYVRRYFHFLYRMRLKKMIKSIGKTDTCLVWPIQKCCAENHKILRSFSTKLVIGYAGGDFHLVDDRVRDLHYPLLDKCDTLIYSSDTYLSRVLSYFGDKYREKAYYSPLWIELLEYMDDKLLTKEMFDSRYEIGPDTKVVAIGYNGRRPQRHDLFVDLTKNILRDKGDLLLMIQATYALENKYKNELLTLFSQHNIAYRLITDYMSYEELALYRMYCDIVISIQTLDASSGSLLEHLAGGAVVIVGDWLPYDHWIDKGIHYHKTSLERLPNVLRYCIDNLDSEKKLCKKNMEIIRSYYSKDALAPIWRQVLGITKA